MGIISSFHPVCKPQRPKWTKPTSSNTTNSSSSSINSTKKWRGDAHHAHWTAKNPDYHGIYSIRYLILRFYKLCYQKFTIHVSCDLVFLNCSFYFREKLKVVSAGRQGDKEESERKNRAKNTVQCHWYADITMRMPLISLSLLVLAHSVLFVTEKKHIHICISVCGISMANRFLSDKTNTKQQQIFL